MSIIIDRTSSDRNYIHAQDDSIQKFFFNYLSDVTFTDTTKSLAWGLNTANSHDWVYLWNTDQFSSLAFSKDLDIIIHPEFLRVYESDYWRALYYDVEIDYNPLRASDYAFHYMNIIMNLWEGINEKADNTVVFLGMKYAYWDHTDFTYPKMVDCALWAKPSAKKVQNSRGNYIRWAIDIVFLLSVNENIQLGCIT